MTKKGSGTFFGQNSVGRAEKWFLTPLLWVAVLVAAAGLRLARLENRPMHCDEAVHGDKFRLLLEHADYTYNPYEYHGPSLNFLTLPVAWLAGTQKLTEVTEVHLRLVPAIFGVLLVGLVWLVRDQLGRPAALWAAVLTAVSPAMVFFSRYYIQEMLLVCFTFGAMIALWRYVGEVAAGWQEKLPGRLRWLRQAFWLVLLGFCIGMMHASKETCVIALMAMALAAAMTMLDLRWVAGKRYTLSALVGVVVAALRRMRGKRLAFSGLVVAVVAGGVSASFFSSFLGNPGGVVDSVTTYFVYLGRASGEGSVGRHYQSWHYYFRILFWWHRGSGPVYSEASIALLALVGLIAGVLGKGLPRAHLPMVRFLGVYTVLMTLVYSAVPYKTPWCALGFLHGMILLAGVGAAVLLRAAPGYVFKGVVIALLVAATGHLAWQAHRASFVAYEDPNNPYVYAHTTGDVPLLAERVKQIAAVHPDAEAMHIQVICPDDDYWPLPWYLRAFRRVQWLNEVPDPNHPSAPPPAPLIITKPTMEDAVVEYAYAKHVPGQPILRQSLRKEGGADWQLRPNVWLRVNVRYDLWEASGGDGTK